GSISKNIITNGTGTYGLYLVTNAGTSTAPLVVSNNMVMFPSTNSTGSGILDNANTYAFFYYNNVLVTGTGASARAFYVDASTTSTRGFNRINNNIFVNTGGGVAVEISTNAVNTKQVDTSDNNDLYVTGATLGKAA